MRRINNNMIWFVAIAVSVAACVHTLTHETPEEKFIRVVEESTERLHDMRLRNDTMLQKIDSMSADTERSNKYWTNKLKETK